MNINSLSIDLAKQYDDQDRLKSFRKEFVGSKPNLIYLDGNSLGRLPLKTKKHLESVINHQWGDTINSQLERRLV